VTTPRNGHVLFFRLQMMICALHAGQKKHQTFGAGGKHRNLTLWFGFKSPIRIASTDVRHNAHFRRAK
jgi:hypothetical protein